MPQQPTLAQTGTPRMRAATNEERGWQVLGDWFDEVLKQPVVRAAGAVADLVDQGIRGNTREDPNWRIASMPLPPETALPMDEVSRLARARQMGYDIDAYRGMAANTEAGQPIEQIASDSKHMGGGFAGFFTDDPSVTARFTDWMPQNSMTVAAKLKMEHPVVIDMTGRHAAEAQWSMGTDRSAYQRMLSALKDPKVDGVILKNTVDEGTVYVPKSPSQIRSRFAAFDPTKASSADLLASLGGLYAGSKVVQPTISAVGTSRRQNR